MVGIEHLRRIEIEQYTHARPGFELPERLHQRRCLRIANRRGILAVNFGKFKTRTLASVKRGSLL